MKLLDLFCGAGGCTKGYQRAGFYVRGVDINLQPRYCGDEFIQADALEYLRSLIDSGEIDLFDVIHASPPCQAYSVMKNKTTSSHPMLIAKTRELLLATTKLYVIENVEGARAYMTNPLMLCGTMFGLRTRRHRLFEINPPIYFMPATCRHWLKTVKQGRYPDEEKHFACVTGSFSNQPYARRAMDIDWMNRKELAQAIPPPYTEYIGKVLLEKGHRP